MGFPCSTRNVNSSENSDLNWSQIQSLWHTVPVCASELLRHDILTDSGKPLYLVKNTWMCIVTIVHGLILTLFYLQTPVIQGRAPKHACVTLRSN